MRYLGVVKRGRRSKRGGAGGRRRPRRDDDDAEEEERRIWVDLTVESRDLDSDPERKAIVSLDECECE